MDSALIQQLKKIRHADINPRAEWVQGNRAVLLAQIKNTLPVLPEAPEVRLERIWSALSIFFPRAFVYNVVRPVVVVVLVTTLAMGSYAFSANASNDALPGDQVLYPVKRAFEAVEKTRVALVGNANDQTKLSLEFAKRRAEEVKQIVNNPDKKFHITEAVTDLKNELQNANDTLEVIKNASNQTLSSQAVTNIKESTDQIKNTLQEVKENLQTSTTTADNDLSKEVSFARELVKDTGVKTIEVVVAKHLADDHSISKETVNSIVETALDAAASDIGDSKVHVDGAKNIVDGVKIEVKDLTAPNARTTVASTASNQVLNQQITTVVAETQAAVVKTDAVSQQVGKTIFEAKALLATGDLTKVIDAIKQVNEASKEAEKISDTAIEKVKTVLPIVQGIKDQDESAGTTTGTPMIAPTTTNSNQKSVIMVTGTTAIVTNSTK